jgi:hypothetical protein
MKNRDLEQELWKVYDEIGETGLEATDRKLKSLDLLVKMRVAGAKIRAEETDAPQGASSTVDRVRGQINK